MQAFNIHRAQAFSWKERKVEIIKKPKNQTIIKDTLNVRKISKNLKNHNLRFKASTPSLFPSKCNG